MSPWALVSGALPGGLSLNASTGAITATPNTAGTFNFSIKVTDSVGNTAISTCTGSCTSVATTWDLSTKLGDLGTSEPYTVNGVTITAYGYTSANAPSNLFGKNDGGDENGIGMVNDSGNDHEIDTAHYIQLDFTQAIAAGATNAQMTIGSVQSGEGFAVYRSYTLGSIGTLLLTGTTTQDAVPFAIPNFPNYKYVAVKATSANVLLNAITFTLGNYTITIAPSGVKVNLGCGSCGGSNSTYILQSFTDTLTATGGNGHYTFSIASGAFPPGMSLNASTGAITGKPLHWGYLYLHCDGCGYQRWFGLRYLYDRGGGVSRNATGLRHLAHVGQSNSATVAPSGGSGAMQFGVIYGSLPPGLSQDANTGKVTGTPTQTGTYMFDTGVMDSKQNWAVTTCTLVVQ